MNATQSAFDFSAPSEPARRNVVIEAGAGTGKTTAIAAEVMRLMLDDPELAPERVVLMTFTEKAAGEIADRIRSGLEHLQSTIDDESPVWPPRSASPLVAIPAETRERARLALAQHLPRIDALRSQTIHSFCQSILRSFPIEAGLDPQFKIVEGFERVLLYSQLYDAWVDEETRTNPRAEHVREWELLFAHSGYLFLIRELIFALVDRRDLLQETEYDFGGFEEIESGLHEVMSTVRRSSESCPDEDAQTVVTYLRSAEPPAAGLEARDAVDAWIAYLQPIAAAMRDANLPRQPVLKEVILYFRTDKSKGSSLYDALVSHRAVMAAVAMTRRFVAYVDEEKRRLGVVDFDDLLLRTLAVLGDPVVLARARAQFDYIFVDEFQDTDRVQARIIEALAKDAGGAFVPGRTVVVGDPKQSIYGFRRADPETYYRMTESLVRGGAERRMITDQYRSDPPLLDAVNAMFDRLFPELPHDPNVFRPPYRRLDAGKPAASRDLDAPFTLLRATCDDRADRYFSEAESIAEWIAARRDGSGDDLRRFAILFRRLTVLDDYLDTFERHGIDYVLPPTRLFLDRRAPVDLLAVLRAIAFPHDRGAMISAARTPYFALTDDEIASGVLAANAPHPPSGHLLPAGGEKVIDARVPSTPLISPSGEQLADARVPSTPLAPRSGERVAEGRVRGDALSNDEATPLPWPSFVEAIARFRDSARHLTVSELIDLVAETTGIERVYAASSDGTRHLRHLEHLRRIAFEYDQRSGGSVRQFVDEITERRDDPDEMEPSLVDETRNAVRILTVHAAKGLEFDSVILPDLAFDTRSGDGGVQFFTVEEPRSLVLSGRIESISSRFRLCGGEPLRKIASKRQEAEMRRLFYVAVTRAKSEVVFVCNTDEKTTRSGFFKCLLEVLTLDKAGLDALWPASGRTVEELPVGGVPTPVALEVVSAREAGERSRTRLIDAELERTLAAGPLASVTIASPVPTPRLSIGEVAARRAGSRSRTAGVLLHRVLELWDGSSDPDPLVRSLALEAAADAEIVDRVRRRLATVAKSETLLRLRSAETVGREVPVRFLDSAGAVVERRIDRLVREHGRELVVDYKSGAPEKDRLQKDRDQVEHYCRAIAAITGRECAGLIWYIDLERDVAVEV